MEALLRLAEPWATLYSDSPALQTVVLFLHLVGVLVGGGYALAADRATLRAFRSGAVERGRHLAELRAVHRPVVAGLTVALASGAAMLAADLETYLVSWPFWTKMGLVALLLANGYALRRAGEAPKPGDAAWRRLRAASLASSVLWLAVLFAGTWLTGMS